MARASLSTLPGVAALPTSQLLRTTGLLHFCASSALVTAGSAVLKAAIAAPAPVGWPVLAAARSTIFRQFTAGERLDEVRGVADRLAAAGVRCIVDHSTEESEEASARQFNLNSKVALLQTLRRELPTTCAFVPIKLTALVSPGLLEKITTAAAAAHGAASSEAAASPDAELRRAASTLSTAEQEDLTAALEALRALCVGSRDAAMPLLLDAEQTPRQPAIRLIARTLSYARRGIRMITMQRPTSTLASPPPFE